MKNKKELTFVRYDDFNGPIFADEEGKLWADLSYTSAKTREGHYSNFYSLSSDYEEPEVPMTECELSLTFPRDFVDPDERYKYMLLSSRQTQLEMQLNISAEAKTSRIEEIIAIWNSIKVKPEWLTSNDISRYQTLLLRKEAQNGK